MVKVKIDPEAELSWSRKRWGRGFRYFDEQGAPLREPAQLRRVRKLAIPPMWQDVRICPTPCGKVQAVGRDLKGRKQYIYHQEWAAERQRRKFRALRTFGKRLPRLRSYALEQLRRKGWPREKVLALMVLILDETGIRIGNRQYLERNETYGLSTLRRRHLDHEDDALLFHYRGKSSKDREVRIEDPMLMRFIRKTAEQPGYEIFRYQNPDGSWEMVDSDDINTFIRDHVGEKFSSKYFRTWVANRCLLEQHATATAHKAQNPRLSLERTLVRLVADELGNTPTVCKNYYLHPVVLRRALRAPSLEVAEERQLIVPDLDATEVLLLRMMRGS